mmetsp:Transcript_21341/g.42387  ORF Transcript_21341/g.42387 Transcript_21341/m.42387 type:complete len:245 (+) Transcript_21341:349-1083(+)
MGMRYKMQQPTEEEQSGGRKGGNRRVGGFFERLLTTSKGQFSRRLSHGRSWKKELQLWCLRIGLSAFTNLSGASGAWSFHFSWRDDGTSGSATDSTQRPQGLSLLPKAQKSGRGCVCFLMQPLLTKSTSVSFMEELRKERTELTRASQLGGTSTRELLLRMSPRTEERRKRRLFSVAWHVLCIRGRRVRAQPRRQRMDLPLRLHVRPQTITQTMCMGGGGTDNGTERLSGNQPVTVTQILSRWG